MYKSKAEIKENGLPEGFEAEWMAQQVDAWAVARRNYLKARRIGRRLKCNLGGALSRYGKKEKEDAVREGG
jgi:hypothetical protein